jgi:GNAT superfamily N-acetyltransferase
MGEVTAIPGRRTGITPPGPLTDRHIISEFDCGNPALNDRLRTHALKGEGRSARTFVINERGHVVGFYTLGAGAVRHDEAPSKLRRNVPNPIPVAILARLAIDKSCQRSGLGSALLQDAFRRIFGLQKDIGVAAVLVHAIDDEAKVFYIKYGMQEFPAGSRTLFLPIETLVKALA